MSTAGAGVRGVRVRACVCVCVCVGWCVVVVVVAPTTADAGKETGPDEPKHQCSAKPAVSTRDAIDGALRLSSEVASQASEPNASTHRCQWMAFARACDNKHKAPFELGPHLKANRHDIPNLWLNSE